MTVYTMGFTQKTAREFFGKIRNEQIDLLIDIRLNNNSQLAGFAKGKDLDFFLSELCGCKYVHKIEFAPTKELLDDYKKNRITWDQYVEVYHQLMDRRNMVQNCGLLKYIGYDSAQRYSMGRIMRENIQMCRRCGRS